MTITRGGEDENLLTSPLYGDQEDKRNKPCICGNNCKSDKVVRVLRPTKKTNEAKEIEYPVFKKLIDLLEVVFDVIISDDKKTGKKIIWISCCHFLPELCETSSSQPYAYISSEGEGESFASKIYGERKEAFKVPTPPYHNGNLYFCLPNINLFEPDNNDESNAMNSDSGDYDAGSDELYATPPPSPTRQKNILGSIMKTVQRWSTHFLGGLKRTREVGTGSTHSSGEIRQRRRISDDNDYNFLSRVSLDNEEPVLSFAELESIEHQIFSRMNAGEVEGDNKFIEKLVDIAGKILRKAPTKTLPKFEYEDFTWLEAKVERNFESIGSDGDIVEKAEEAEMAKLVELAKGIFEKGSELSAANRNVSSFYVVEFPKKRKMTLKADTKRSYKTKYARIIHEILIRYGDDDLQKRIVEHLVKSNMSGGSVSWTNDSKDNLLDIYDVMAIREEGGHLSTNQIISVLSGIKTLTGLENLYPGQLKKKLGEIERSLLPANTELREAEVDGKKKKMCIFYYIKQIPFLLESLVVASFRDGTFQEAFSFSNFENTILFFRGTDRGGGDTIDMTRLGNRENGNHGRYSVPVAVLEEGSESYDNLKNTCFSEERNKVFDMMGQEKLHCITVIVLEESGEDEPKSRKKSQCCLIQFDIEDNLTFAPHKLNITCTYDTVCWSKNDTEYASFLENGNEADDYDRVLPGTVRLTKEMIGGSTDLHLTITLVQEPLDLSPMNDGAEIEISTKYIGMIISSSAENQPSLYTFEFASPLEVIDNERLNVSISKVRSISTNDAKLNVTVLGLGSCGSSYPFPCCIRHVHSIDIPCWMEEYCDKLLYKWEDEWGDDSAKQAQRELLKYNDYDRREGRLSLHNTFAEYQKNTGGHGEFTNSQGESINENRSKMEAYSTTSPALFSFTNLLTSCPPDAMHVFEGLVNHLNKDSMILLRRINTNMGQDLERFDVASISEQIAEADELVKDLQKNKDYLKLKRKLSQYEKKRDRIAVLIKAESLCR